MPQAPLAPPHVRNPPPTGCFLCPPKHAPPQFIPGCWLYLYIGLLFSCMHFDSLELDLCFCLSLVLISHLPQCAPSFAFRCTFPSLFSCPSCLCTMASALSSLESFLLLLLCSQILALLLDLFPLRAPKSLELMPYSIMFH